MPGKTRIEWSEATWNPVTGCTQVSAGCDHCYALRLAERFRGVPGHPYEQGFDLRLWPERLTAPLGWTTPRRVFVNSMSDLFHAGVPAAFVAEVFATMAQTPRHTYQVLTKRPQRMVGLLRNEEFVAGVRELVDDCHAVGDPGFLPAWPGWPLPNVWLGVSVESQEMAWRLDWLLKTPAAVRFVSCEPLLGPLDLWPYLQCGHEAMTGTGEREVWECDGCHALLGWEPDAPGRPWSGRYRLLRRGQLLDWVIAGGESGPGFRPVNPDWLRSLRDQCRAAEVPFFFKQWGGLRRQAGGRLLDGREWHEYPEERR